MTEKKAFARVEKTVENEDAWDLFFNDSWAYEDYNKEVVEQISEYANEAFRVALKKELKQERAKVWERAAEIAENPIKYMYKGCAGYKFNKEYGDELATAFRREAENDLQSEAAKKL